MDYRKEEAYQHALCMDLTPDKFQFSILDPKKKVILHFEEFSLATYAKEEVKSKLSHDLLQLDFATYSLSAGTKRNTLIPSSLFNFAKSNEIFKLNFSEPFEDLDYNRLSDLGIVNIYEVPFWIKSLFVVRFPRIKIVHRSTVLLRGVFDQAIFKPRLNIFIEEEQFYLLITDRSQLKYYNRFDYKTFADLVYYVLFVLEQKEILQDEIEIELFGINETWLQASKIQDFFSTKLNLNHEIEKGKNFMLAKQLLCV